MVDCTGLENQRGGNLSVSSNLTPSATHTIFRPYFRYLHRFCNGKKMLFYSKNDWSEKKQGQEGMSFYYSDVKNQTYISVMQVFKRRCFHTGIK